ncbi:MAG: hypothetical protein HY843_05290 [Bdellovibrio sp.]|nr:hypothetical protein [Bdellovibrio sp.]
MRFTTARADTVAQNLTLKVAIGFLTLCVFVLVLTASKLALKAPLVIERACFSKAVKAASTASAQHSPQEVESFVKEAVSLRFDSDAEVKPGYLSFEEEKFRQQEQKEFSNRNMSQKVIVNSVKIDGAIVKVETDRMISVGQIRSAFNFPLVLNLATSSRTDGNPYGLLLTNATSPKKEELK